MRILLLLICLQSATAVAAPRVVTSITPLQELTAAIMDGVGEPDVIIGGDASAHHFAFKPSDLRRLWEADLVIWVDRHFESGFNRVPEILPASTLQLELLPALGIKQGDGHIWLSAKRLRQSARFIVLLLSELDPVNRPVYEENADDLVAALDEWHADASRRLSGKRPALIADHNFLAHFTGDLGLDEVVAVNDTHDHHGGIRRLQELEKHIDANPVSCLVSVEPTPSSVARTLALKYRLKSMRVEDSAEGGAKSILGRLEQLTRLFEQCR